MKRLILFLLVVSSLHAQGGGAVNCSYGTMTWLGSNGACTASEYNSTPIDLINTQYWADKCVTWNTGGTLYWSKTSGVTGYGECFYVKTSPVVCLPDNEIQTVTPATPANGAYNQFYNRMYDTLWESPGECPRDGGGRQDFQQCNAQFCYETCIECERGGRVCGYNPQCPPSPIVVDTTGKGFRLTSDKDGPPEGFDFAGNGRRIKSGWPDADSGNAFLVCLSCWKDLPNTGKVESGKYQFGNYTEQTCVAGVRNGYCALAEFDSNGDKVIDWRDAVWPKLLLWIDANHDGISQPSELHTLPELGVYSISLKYSDDTHEDQYGNQFRYKAALNPNPLDGTSRDGRMTYDVFFAVEQPKCHGVIGKK